MMRGHGMMGGNQTGGFISCLMIVFWLLFAAFNLVALLLRVTGIVLVLVFGILGTIFIGLAHIMTRTSRGTERSAWRLRWGGWI